MRSVPTYIRYRPHIPSPLGPNYIEEWKELIDFYLSKRYATEISDEPVSITTVSTIYDLFVCSFFLILIIVMITERSFWTNYKISGQQEYT